MKQARVEIKDGGEVIFKGEVEDAITHHGMQQIHLSNWIFALLTESPKDWRPDDLDGVVVGLFLDGKLESEFEVNIEYEPTVWVERKEPSGVS